MSQVAIGSYHAGFLLKNELADILSSLGYEVCDVGTYSEERVDYPDFGVAVAEKVAEGDAVFGVCVCGSGLGIAMAANKISGVRSATIYDSVSARLSREHNDANVACFGARLIGLETAMEALKVFCETEFEGGRHAARVRKSDEII